MSKNITTKLIALFLALTTVIVLSSCAKDIEPSAATSEQTQKTPTPETQESETAFVYDKYSIEPDIRAYIDPQNEEFYKAVYDAVDQVLPELDISIFNADAKEIEEQKHAIQNKSNTEFFYFNGVDISDDGNKFIFRYAYDADTCREMKKNFNDKVNEILTTVVKPDDSEFEKESAIYKYIVQNVSYADTSVTDGNFGIYDALVDHETICYGYSYAMKYLLNQVGIECWVTSSDEISHMWNVVKIDGEYYMLDATYEASYYTGTGGKSNYTTLLNFSYYYRKNIELIHDWKCGTEPDRIIPAPACTSERYKDLRIQNY